MDSSNWIALAAVLSVTLVGFVGPIIAGVQRRRADHEQHTRDRRADVYIDLLVSLERDCAWMERTYPFMGPMPDPPAPPTDQENWTLGARVAAYGSERVKALLEQWNVKVKWQFWIAAGYLRKIEEVRTTRTIFREGFVEELGTTEADQRLKLDALRREAKLRLEEIQRAVASELQIAPPSAARQDPSDRFNAWLERTSRGELPQRDDLAG